MMRFAACDISRQEAAERLARHRFWRRQPQLPQHLELVYLPHYLFEVKTSLAKSQGEKITADAIQGHFAYFDESIAWGELRHDAERFPFRLSVEAAQDTCLQQYRRALLQTSLNHRRHIEIEQVRFLGEFYFPFWIGYFRRGRGIAFAVIDAVGGQSQGPKMHNVLMQAFASSRGEARES